jgi:uncharacterized protein YigA (DUF484 family)
MNPPNIHHRRRHRQFQPTPDFSSVTLSCWPPCRLSSGHGSRAVSLQERQAGMLREKIKGLETRVVMIRHGNDNEVIASRAALDATHAAGAACAASARCHRCRPDRDLQIPQAGIRVWDTAPRWPLKRSPRCGEDIRRSPPLTAPYCGIIPFEAVSWLADSAAVQSLALIPLVSSAPRAGAVAPCRAFDPCTADAERFRLVWVSIFRAARPDGRGLPGAFAGCFLTHAQRPCSGA